jgi:hypothetical protein
MKFKNTILFLIYQVLIFNYSIAMAYDEANYKVVKKNDIFEIRLYSERLAVETVENNQNSGFRKLFNYISGNNKTNEKIKMTTPVTRIERDGNMTMQFYLPSKYNSRNVPNPTREDVRVLTIAGGYYAALRYSGRASDKNFIKHKEILEKELKDNSVTIISLPIRATYDSPFTLPMNRRNEAMFKVEIN